MAVSPESRARKRQYYQEHRDEFLERHARLVRDKAERERRRDAEAQAERVRLAAIREVEGDNDPEEGAFWTQRNALWLLGETERRFRGDGALLCGVPSCESLARKRGLCLRHLRRERRWIPAVGYLPKKAS